MGFFSKLFARNPDEDPFMPGKPVVVGGFGIGRIQRMDTLYGNEVFVVRMDHLPPRNQHLYVATDGTGFPMRVPLSKDEAQRQLELLVPREDKGDWNEIAEAFADVRQRSKSASDLQRLLNHMYATADLGQVEQKKMLEWVENSLFSELGLALGRTPESLREEVRARFKVPHSPPKKSWALGALADAPLLGDLAPIGSFAVEKGITVYDPLSALETAEELAVSDEIARKIPPRHDLRAKAGTWHGYVKRAKDGYALQLTAVHASVVPGAPAATKEVGIVAAESQFLAIVDAAIASDTDFVAEEIEFSFEPFPRITDGRGVAVDLLPPGAYAVRVAEQDGEAVAIEIELTEVEKPGAESPGD